MSSVRPPGHPEQPPGPVAAAGDPAIDAAVRIQRRRHRWGVSVFWFIGALAVCVGINSSANSAGTPSPPWFIGLTIAFGVAAAVALGAAIGYSVALRRYPAAARKQAFALEGQRRLRQWRYGWTGRLYNVFYWSAAWLGMALILGCVVIGVPLAINGVTYLAGSGQAVRWSAAMPIHSDGDAVGSLVIGLLFVFGGVLVVYFFYRRVTRVWWPRFVARRARAFGG